MPQLYSIKSFKLFFLTTFFNFEPSFKSLSFLIKNHPTILHHSYKSIKLLPQNNNYEYYKEKKKNHVGIIILIKKKL